jgi:hypothetical protein
MSERSMFLFAMPRAFEGLGRLVDLGSTFDQYNTSEDDATADERAFTQDWAAVGDDLGAAAERVIESR